MSGKGNNRLVVKVWDPTDEGYQPRGKQVNNPEGIWYTPVTGIWQTVWLEPVTARHIEELRITPDIDQHLLTVKAHLNMRAPSDLIEVNVYDGNQLVATGKVLMMRLWSYLCRKMLNYGVLIFPFVYFKGYVEKR